jgi:hypothetical protein
MTGYQSKKKAAQDKLAQPAQEPMCPECKAGVLYECVACSSNNYPQKPAQEPVATVQCIHGITIGYLEIIQPVGTKLYTAPPQRTWVDLTHDEWFKCWLTLHAADETEAEFDFADFLIIARAVLAKFKEANK